MDGNGRWARQRDLPRTEGHRAGAESVRAIVTESRRLGIEYLTLYAFSSQNWSRPQDEVSNLMQLLVEFCQSERQLMVDKDIRLRVIGQRSRLPSYARDAIESVEAATVGNESMELLIAVSYGSREEIVQAVRAIAREVAAGRLEPETIDEDVVDDFLWTRGVPDPDLVIRTSGELRVSNFLLWQIAYAELYVDERLWPDFREEAFHEALASYADRDRRFGRAPTAPDEAS
jgi:undecaprenyl diphosphate synthase